MSAQRCACGHYQLPETRDAVVALPGGQSDQHGRLHCERITLGAQVYRKAPRDHWYHRTLGDDAAPREITLQRLDRH